MGTFEMTIALVTIIESNCPTNVSKTYDEAVTILTNYMEDEMAVTTDGGETFSVQVKNAQLILERYKQALLDVSLSIQVVATNQNEVHEMSERIVSDLKNGRYRFSNFLLYNDEEDEVYRCKIASIKEIRVPVKAISELEVAV